MEALSAAAVHVRGGVEDGPAHVRRRGRGGGSPRKSRAVCLPVLGWGVACRQPALLPRGGGGLLQARKQAEQPPRTPYAAR